MCPLVSNVKLRTALLNRPSRYKSVAHTALRNQLSLPVIAGSIMTAQFYVLSSGRRNRYHKAFDSIKATWVEA